MSGSDTKTYVINMASSAERREDVRTTTSESGARWQFVRGFNGREMDADPRTATLLEPYKHLIGTTVASSIGKDGQRDSWKYDGTAATCFSNMQQHGHRGTKGLTLSNMWAMREATHDMGRDPGQKWACIAEDDAVLDKTTMGKVQGHLDTATHPVVWLDDRGRGGTSMVCYTSEALQRAQADLHPMSAFAQEPPTCHTTGKAAGCRRSNLWDWFSVDLWDKEDLVEYHAVVESDDGTRYKSTISSKKGS